MLSPTSPQPTTWPSGFSGVMNCGSACRTNSTANRATPYPAAKSPVTRPGRLSQPRRQTTQRISAPRSSPSSAAS